MSKVTTIFAASALLFGISVFCYAQTLPKSMVQTMTYAEATKHSEFLLPKSIPAFIPNTAIEKAIVTVLKVPETDGTHEFIIFPGYAQIRVMSPYFDEGSFTIGSEYIPGARLLSKQVIGGELKISDGTAFYGWMISNLLLGKHPTGKWFS